jgi:hypothetical protein
LLLIAPSLGWCTGALDLALRGPRMQNFLIV